MKKVVLLIASFGLTLTMFAQTGKLKKADEQYAQNNYAYAVNLYQDLQGTSVDNIELKSKLAFSYMKLGQYQNAVKEYSAMMMDSESVKAIDFYNYSYVLKMAGDYEESDKWMNKFSEKAPSDSRAQAFLANKNYKEKIEGTQAFFAIDESRFNSTGIDFGGYLNPEGNYLYFLSSKRKTEFVKHQSARDKKPFLDLYRIYIDQEKKFGGIEKVKTASSKFNEGPITFSADGRTAYVTRNELGKTDGLQRLKIYVVDVTEGGSFMNERPFKYNSDNYSIGHPSLSADGSTLYLVSDKPGGFGGADIYRVEVLGNGNYGEMINLGETVNTEGQEMFPFIDADNRLFFSSDGHIGLGGLDVYVGFIRGKSVVEIENLGVPVNSQYDDFAFTWYANENKGFVSSSRDGGLGEDDIYNVESLRPLVYGLLLKGKATDNNGSPITYTMMELRDEKGRLLQSAFTDENGSYSFNVPYEGNYILKATKQDYFKYTNRFNTFTKNNAMRIDATLESDPGFSLAGIVTNRFTKEIIENVEVTIVDLETKEKTVLYTSYVGDFIKGIKNKQLKDKGSYEITLKKDGFETNKLTFNVTYENKGQYNIQTVEDLTMKPK